MKITTKYNIGDSVYPLSHGDYIKKQCETCHGEKNIDVEINSSKRLLDCPDCEGTGIISVWHDDWRSHEMKELWKIQIDITIIGEKINYWFYCLDWFKESEIFSTKAEAEKECEKRNKLLTKTK